MKSLLAVSAALLTSANALVARGGTCCFHLTATGPPSGPVDQLPDGQNRVGAEGLPEGLYCINSSGEIVDGEGRGCFFTRTLNQSKKCFQDQGYETPFLGRLHRGYGLSHPETLLTLQSTAPTTQFQCDVGGPTPPGFAISCKGALSYNGQSTFYACVTGDNGENIYLTTSSAETGCTPITLTADQCFSPCPSPSPPKSECPGTLEGEWEFPHLIVPINCEEPETAYGTQFDGQVTPNAISTIFNFDIPESDEGESCTLVFFFPEQSQLETSSYSLSGSGSVDFGMCSAPATTATTYETAPSIKTDYGAFTLEPGMSYTIAEFECPAGQKIAFEMSSSSTSFSYFQDYNPCP